MTARRSATAAAVVPLVVALAAGAACGDAGQQNEAGGMRDRREATLRQQELSLKDDSITVIPMRSLVGPYRVLYDAPVDLSYANAARRRPELVYPDSARRIAATAAAAARRTDSGRRDTTGGDALSDTSGGAARAPSAGKPPMPSGGVANPQPQRPAQTPRSRP